MKSRSVLSGPTGTWLQLIALSQLDHRRHRLWGRLRRFILFQPLVLPPLRNFAFGGASRGAALDCTEL